ncbi:hypothetical protein DEJ50_19950 [Streptomyces venezuelae]|uniref:Integral membrane protein n=1 Tax=Streptomyces venezuelae TaxID=54571 RepID=A0A5P2D6C6_STRVZ|nr:hypothetical protein [Streptomyces venezuelae]QES49747.1 hypothetical protein DEJ50_19950 [Streptomyces venezuelae]
MPDSRQSSTPPSAPNGDDNPFAAPPEGRPDQPWQPRNGADEHRRNEEPSGGPGNTNGGGPARWDPTDPVQRRARYALLAGMWGFFFGLFGIPSMGLLLGALALYWGITALRGTPKPPTTETPSPSPLPAPYARPQRTAAVSGLVTASLAILFAVGSYTLQIVYKDFYVCREDALTQTAELKCNNELPKPLRGILGIQS